MRTISRDPFARLDTVRHVAKDAATCGWCGAGTVRALVAPGGTPGRIVARLYRYGTQDDTGRTAWDRRAYCSIGCRLDWEGR